MSSVFVKSCTSLLALALGIGVISAPSAPQGFTLATAQAQGVDEDTNVRVYQQASPAVVAIDSGSVYSRTLETKYEKASHR